MAVETDDSVDSAIRKDITEGEYMLESLRQRRNEFEEQYGMSSEEFMEKFESGDLGDGQDYFEWYALTESIQHLENKTEKLRKKV
jgi:hypothetical protein